LCYKINISARQPSLTWQKAGFLLIVLKGKENMNTKKILFSVLFSALVLGVPKVALANNYEEEEVPRQILVDKTIKNPNISEYWDNLDSSVVVFTADDLVDFKVRVKNTGDKKLKNIKVIDTLPPYVSFVSGYGSYDSAARTLTWTIGELEPNQESTFDIQVKVYPSDQLPWGGTVCVINKAEAWAETGEYDYDTSQFCIETRILAKEVPVTGIDPNLALQALGCVSLMGVGLKLRRYR